MAEWVKWSKSMGDPEWMCYSNPNPKPYRFYKIRKGDIIPITLNQAIAQTDLIFNSGAFKVKEICKDDGVEVVFRMEYIKEESEPMTKAEAMFDKLGYEVMPPVSQTQCQAQSEDRDTIIDIEVTKWRGHDGKYLKLTKDEIEACIQVIREMGEKYEYC